MATQTLWQSLERKSHKLPASSSNLFQLLKERSKLENTRPDTIDFAHLKHVVEHEMPQKASQTAVKRNILNVSYFVVTNPKTNQYFRLDAKEKFLWDHMDGYHTIRDLALAYYNEYGAFAYDKIIELVYDLRKKTFLTVEHVDIYEELSLAAKSKQLFRRIIHTLKHFLYWEFPLHGVDPWFALLYRTLFVPLFSPIIGAALVLFVIGGFGVFVMLSMTSSVALLTHQDSLVWGTFLLVLLNFATLFLHEIAHGVATKHFGRSVHKAGFLLYFGLPAFYVDTTDMWLESRNRRIFVSLVGPFAELVVAGIISVMLLFFSTGMLAGVLYKFAFISYLSVFVNLNPLVEWDGYFVLIDFLRIPCLRRRSLHFIAHDLLPRLKNHQTLTREERIYTVFGILSAVWSAVATVFGFRFWRRHIRLLIPNVLWMT